MTAVVGVLALLAGCAPADTGTGGASFRLFAGEPGRLYELRPPVVAGDTGSDTGADTAAATPSRWLRIDEAAWTLTEGADVDTAALVATWALTLEGGLRLDDTPLLPETVLAGATVEGATVRAVGPWETVYGTFPEAAEVEVTGAGAGDGGGAGAWAGTQVFAKGVGPVYLTLPDATGAGVPWETAWYE